MAHGSHGRRCQPAGRQRVGPRGGQRVARLRRAAQQQEPSAFAALLDRQEVERVFEDHRVAWREKVFTPLVTLYAFLDQVLSPDGSCRAAVARVLVRLVGAGEPACSANTGGYCHARQRLPEAVPQALMQQVGRRLYQTCAGDNPKGLLRGRTIKIVDGSTLSMPDTPANQGVYPQARTQKPGLGFPIARILALFCLYSGAVVDAAMGPYRGKQTGENALFRGLLPSLKRGDVLAGDCGFGSYWNFAMLGQRGVDAIFPLHQCRPEDFRRGRRLGKEDRLVTWRKPRQRPEWMDEPTYQSMPEQLTLRQVRVHINIPGFRVQTLTLVTTLVDSNLYPKVELAQVYHGRWHAELDLRSLKSAMGMDVLRGKSPSMVHKEFWMHLLAYNLIRTVMAQAAAAQRCPPRQISFTGAWQTLHAFAPLAATATGEPRLYAALLQAIATHRVGDRPNRVEPRAVKRRPKPHALLTKPREKARNRLYLRKLEVR